jgi:hypothetical protein
MITVELHYTDTRLKNIAKYTRTHLNLPGGINILVDVEKLFNCTIIKNIYGTGYEIMFKTEKDYIWFSLHC